MKFKNWVCLRKLHRSGLDVQRSPLFCANIVKKDPGRTRQNSLATAGTNFTKPGAHNKGDLCNKSAKWASILLNLSLFGILCFGLKAVGRLEFF